MTTTPEQLYRILIRAGVRLFIREDGRGIYKAPASLHGPALLSVLKMNGTGLVEILRRQANSG
jgi:hypothetical protein